jgi:hypothetical protein
VTGWVRTLLAGIALLAAGPLAAQEQTRVAGFETYAVVAPITDEISAIPFAERHCAKYDRFARFRWMDGAKAIFDCQVRKLETPRSAAKGSGLY